MDLFIADDLDSIFAAKRASFGRDFMEVFISKGVTGVLILHVFIPEELAYAFGRLNWQEYAEAKSRA